MSSAGGEDPSVVDTSAWTNSQAAAQAQAQAAQQLGALFGLPRYSGVNTDGQAYSNQLKPGNDNMVRRLMQARINEGVTNAFTPRGNYMPAWAVQQPTANWLGARPNPRSYFPGIDTVSGGQAGVGTNLGFGTLFGALAPSTQAAGGTAPLIPENTAVNSGTSTPPVFPPVGGGWVPGGGGQGGTLPGGLPLATPEQPGGQGPATPPITGGLTPLENWQPAGKTPSGIGSTQYPVYKAPTGAKPSGSTPATTIRGKTYTVATPEGSGYETYLRTILAAAGGGPGINNVGLAAAQQNPALVAGYGNTPNWEPWMLGTITPYGP